MRKSIDVFREKHENTTRLVLFQLAALTANCFLFLPCEGVTTAKKMANAVCALALHGIAYKAAKYLEHPKVQPDNQTRKQRRVPSATSTESVESIPLAGCPATP